ncbi:hypothetical protein RchiOBHm_Chr7g0227631 [Rosa chinensis]|uniref:Uncharacterized protein n=1 Tax=Rosa chinensis TaxID=74649 RepID=A0A2P6PEN5_ROSCH|nr:hypothetical protein RchiOBHm_Chr7g0227631 [Rosa chinensis]
MGAEIPASLHTFKAKGQYPKRWSAVSLSVLQTGQELSKTDPNLESLSLVFSLPRRKSQAKILTFGGTFSFHILLMRSIWLCLFVFCN